VGWRQARSAEIDAAGVKGFFDFFDEDAGAVG
jgi:hypothetical protein